MKRCEFRGGADAHRGAGRAWGGAAVCGGVNTRPCTMLVTTAGAEGAVGGWGGVEPVVAAVRRCARHVPRRQRMVVPTQRARAPVAAPHSP